MPLSRYEIRSEYSLANPDLYRAADKDDPEGLLEGVAMAGLVGIIRLLGDLAEFAAEVFHDLHEDILATGARGHEVHVRIQHLEIQVPLIEKMMLTKNDPGNCLYNPGLEWHPYIHDEQNHFTQGDLPRFIRSAYEDCRSPPRLFTLDRYDAAGAGSCLKRFTDPSFFKMEWASSQLMKAEKEQRDQKAQRLKRKGQRRQGLSEAERSSYTESRMTGEVESKGTSRLTSSASDSSLDSAMQAAVDSLMQENDNMLSATGSLVSEQDGLQSQDMSAQDFEVKELPCSSLNSRTEHETLDAASPASAGLVRYAMDDAGKGEEVIADDSASETDNFLDAVTTMDSEVETDTELKPRTEMNGEVAVEPVALATEPQKGEAEGDNFVTEDQGRVVNEKYMHEEENQATMMGNKEGVFIKEDKEGPVLEEGVACGEHTLEVSSDTERIHFVEGLSVVLAEEEECFSAGGSGNITSVLDNDASIPGFAEEIDAKPEGDVRDNIPIVLAEEGDSNFLVKNADVFSMNDDVPALVSPSNGSSSSFEEDAVLNPERLLQSGDARLVLDISTIDTSIVDSLSEKKPLAGSDWLPELDVVVNNLPQSEASKDFGVASTRRRWQITRLFSNEILASNFERARLQVTEIEQSESPRKLSLQSSPSSSIQPMKWTVDFSKSYDTDDEMEGMQVSSVSPSSSSSTLSSPRPSTLTSTLDDLNLDQKPQKPCDASSSALLRSSGVQRAPDKPVPQVTTTTEPHLSPGSNHLSPRSSSSAEQPFFDFIQPVALNLSSGRLADKGLTPSLLPSNLEVSPPPPPLPPLAWRMIRRTQNTVVNAQNPMESPTSIPAPVYLQAQPNEPSQAFTLSSTVPSVSKFDQLTHALSSPTIGKSTSLKHEGLRVESMRSSHNEAGGSDPELYGMIDDLVDASIQTRSCDGGASLTPISNICEQDSLSAFAMPDPQGGKIVTAEPDSGLEDQFIDKRISCISPVLPTSSIPSSLDDSRLGSQNKVAEGHGASAEQKNNLSSVLASKTEVKESMQASVSKDMSMLKTRSKWALTSSTASSDDREVLLDQIRTRSFNLRNNMGREKLAAPRPVTNINVAAILEKANSIRQAFAGSSDEDEEEWGDA